MIVVKSTAPRRSLLKTALMMLGAIFCLCVLLAVAGNMADKREPPADVPRPTAVPSQAHDALTLESFRATVSAGGSLLNISGQIVNSDARERRDVGIECAQNGASGTAIRTRRETLFEVIPANGRKDFRNISIGIADPQMKSVTCRIVSASY